MCKNNHFCQLTVISKKLSRKVLSKLLNFSQYIKKAIFIKACTKIIPQIKKNLNNIHSNIKSFLTNIKNTNTISLNSENVQVVITTLNTYNITFKHYQIPKYVELYEKSKEKFIQTCVYCSNKYMYSPMHYFTKVFQSSNTFKGFSNFTEREYDYEKLEKLLLKNNY